MLTHIGRVFRVENGRTLVFHIYTVTPDVIAASMLESESSGIHPPFEHWFMRRYRSGEENVL